MSKELEPIAIVGIGCRFPGGAENPTKFWEVMNNGIDGIVDVPADRWDKRRFYDSNKERMGKMHAAQAGFLQSPIDEFDPLFFGISPREAAVLDPQQRLLLEITWEAFEDAGIREDQLRGSNTGVFIGGFTLDNKLIQLGVLNREILSSNTATSSTMVMLSNRISYTFDLRGPSVTMDTACSSSLVAAHYACQSIWSGETELAITGGANTMLTPEYPITMSKGQFLSDHSRCKAFDADARGYVRGEGGGIVILKPLSKAEADGDFIYGTIRATGANQDGATQGITVPSPTAQAELVKKVYERANVTPDMAGYIEAHGTGTKAGDPVEIKALETAISQGRSADDKCYVGSVKTNIGHLEAGAGVAGLIKATLAAHHRQIPPNLHFNNPNPDIDFENLHLQVPTSVTPWPADKKRAITSINSFGYGGTNAHVLVEGYENPAAVAVENDRAADAMRMFPISARSEKALKQNAKNLIAHFNENEVNLNDLHYTLAHRRTQHHNRLAITATSIAELKEKLSTWADDGFGVGMMNGTAQADVQGKLVFVYTGMGPQWWGMGRQLLESEPVFRNKIEECDVIFKKIAGWSMIEELMRPESESKMERTEVAQPGNFAIQIGLTALWNHWGIYPDAVVGHSVGEVAAAYVSGALSLEDGLLVSYHRSRIQQKTAGQGKMLAIGLSEEEAEAKLNGNPKISIAAINSFKAVTLGGDEEALKKFGEELDADKVFNKMLRVEVAYHSYQMEPLKNELFESLASITPHKPKIKLYSTVTGEEVKGADFGTEYWWKNVRQSVRFAKAITTIIADGYTGFIEVGPHPVTKTSINECLSAAEVSGNVVGSLIRKENEMQTMMDSLSQLYTIGYEPDWNVVAPKANYTKLPSYAWQKEVYRHETDRSKEYRLGNEGHVFLNDNLRQPEPAWEVELNTQFLPWLNDHQVEKTIVVPGAAYVEAGLAIHQKEFTAAACVLQDLKFNQVLVIDPDKVQKFQTRYDHTTRTYSVYSREDADTSGWQLHARGRMLETNLGEDGGTIDLAALKSGFSTEIAPSDMYETLTGMGLYYGPYFQGLKQIHVKENEVLCRVEGQPDLEANTDNYIMHPSILDSAFQSMVSLVGDEENTTPYVPVNIDKFVLYKTIGNKVWCHGTITDRGTDSITGNIVFVDDEGNVLANLTGLKCRALTAKHDAAEKVEADWFYGLEWKPTEEVAEADLNTKMAIITHELNEDVMEMIAQIGATGVDVSVIENAENFETTDLGWQLNFNKKEDWEQLTDGLIAADIRKYSFVLKNVNDADMFGTAVSNTVPVTYFANAISEKSKDVAATLNLITKGAQKVAETDKEINQSGTALWGFGQLVTNEYPWLNTRMIDTDPNGTDWNATLVADLLSDERTSEIAFRDGKRFVKELVRQEMTTLSNEEAREKISTENAVELNFGNDGRIDDLLHNVTERRAPDTDEIEVKVHSASINFKDLLKVLNQISQDVLDGTYFGNAFGMECSGTITRVGANVTDHKVGDELVVATVDGCFRSYVTLVPEYTMPRPSTLKMEEMPITIPYMTTIHGLTGIADIQKGEKILIHNAAGAVGQAAIQVAKWRGAEIFATAGTEEKRAFIRSLGIEHVMNSRDLNFTTEILKITDGYGVDVVLNAIAGEGLYQSFKLLAPYGRFIEIGKRDIGENTALPMAVFNRNITFAHIDIDRIMKERNPLACSLLKKVYDGFEQGHFAAMPTKVFGASESIEAFDYVRRSEHTGKVAIRYVDENVEVAAKVELNAIDPEGTYLITGGTGGFGLEIAKHLASKGVKQLVLLSRSGLKNEDAQLAVKEMEAAGVAVVAPPTDITNAEQVSAVIASLENGIAPLKGIFHGAMVLDDGFLNTMTQERFEYVMRPKIQGALNLHNAVGDAPLDFFISFSSISSVIGNAGQANYVAANAFLDGFAHFRRALGLKATTVNLGVLGQVGVVARDADVGRLLEGAGIHSFSNAMALESLEHIIANDLTQVGLFNINWKRWATGNPTGSATSLFASMVDSQGGDDSVSEITLELLGNMAGMEKAEQQAHLEGIVCKAIAQVLRVPVENIDMSRGINFLGIDSLMAVELERGINGGTGVEISTMELLSGPTVPQLAGLILGKLPDPSTLDIKPTEEVNVDEMSEEELDKMLESVG